MSKLSDQAPRDPRDGSGDGGAEALELRHQLFNLRLQKERGEVKNNRQFPQTGRISPA